ncbi:LOW QUALITY PROTEIN: E3 ubiquitin-protein ligase Topors-like [Cyanocitta cristata]
MVRKEIVFPRPSVFPQLLARRAHAGAVSSLVIIGYLGMLQYLEVCLASEADLFAEDSNFSPKASTSKLPTDASPDSKCPICLDRFDNVAYLDRCLHRFCFRCVQEWSKNKAECPLCKQPFFSIFHTIRAEDDFKEYILSPLETSSFASPDGRRFHYRTTLTRERRTCVAAGCGKTPNHHTDGEEPGELEQECPGKNVEWSQRPELAWLSGPLQDALESKACETIPSAPWHPVDPPVKTATRTPMFPLGEPGTGPMAPPFPQEEVQPSPPSVPTVRNDPLRRRWNGVVHNAIVEGDWQATDALACPVLIQGDTARMLSPPDNGMLFEGLSSEPVRHRHREIQQMIRRLASRRKASAEGRSLRQIQEEDMINFRRALYRTGVRIRSIQDGGRYRDISAEFFCCNPCCPFNLEAYDQHASYDCPAPSYEEGSHSDSSIITISPDVAYSQGPDNSLSVPGLGQAPWDDETPGPFYSISEEVRATIASPLESSESSDEDSATTKLQTELQANVDSNDSGSSSDNCVIVGYVKPLAERTPEVVELSSDSEESIREEKREDVKKQRPVQCHSWSDSEPSRSFSPHSPTYREDKGKSSYRRGTEKGTEREKERRRKKKKTGIRLLPLLPGRPVSVNSAERAGQLRAAANLRGACERPGAISERQRQRDSGDDERRLRPGLRRAGAGAGAAAGNAGNTAAATR